MRQIHDHISHMLAGETRLPGEAEIRTQVEVTVRVVAAGLERSQPVKC